MNHYKNRGNFSGSGNVVINNSRSYIPQFKSREDPGSAQVNTSVMLVPALWHLGLLGNCTRDHIVTRNALIPLVLAQCAGAITYHS